MGHDDPTPNGLSRRAPDSGSTGSGPIVRLRRFDPPYPLGISAAQPILAILCSLSPIGGTSGSPFRRRCPSRRDSERPSGRGRFRRVVFRHPESILTEFATGILASTAV
jgi:hypothetical protein